MQWPAHRIVKQLPFAYRVWAAYLRMAPRNSIGGTPGASRLLRTIQRFSANPNNIQDGFAVLRDPSARYALAIDLLDFESFVHTLDCWLDGTDESRMLGHILQSGDVFFDVGSNHGLYGLLASASRPEDTQIVAFEPQPRAAAAIQRSIDANAFRNLTLVREAVSSHVGETSFFVPAFGSGTASISQTHASRGGSAKEIRCRTTTLDDYARSHAISKIDIMKIDVEGFEGRVLEGGKEIISASRPTIWLEVNSLALSSAGSSQEECFDRLKTYGYEEFWDVASLFASEAKPITGEVIELTNVVAVHPSRREFFWNAIRDDSVYSIS